MTREAEQRILADRILQDWLRHRRILTEDALRLAEIILGLA